jgi:tetratricopeptide (TPR) repeat protein
MLLSVDDCINEAFRLKERGDSEGAILYYMYALDKNPDKDLTFWIILDICVLYKSLGQAELARDILESIIAGYGNVLDVSVKAEIERNLY